MRRILMACILMLASNAFIGAAETPEKVSNLPVTHFKIDKHGRLVRIRPSTFWFEGTISPALSTTRDPFGHFGSERFFTPGLSGSLKAGMSFWSVDITGQHLINGGSGIATVRAHLRQLGPLRLGIVADVIGKQWNRAMFTYDDTVLGTSRTVTAIFGGIEIGRGNYAHTYWRLVMEVGSYRSVYDGTLSTPGLSGHQRLALDKFSLGLVRLEATNITLGHMKLSGSITCMRANGQSLSIATPDHQLSANVSATRRIWALSSRSAIELTSSLQLASAGPTLLDDQSFTAGIGWRFR